MVLLSACATGGAKSTPSSGFQVSAKVIDRFGQDPGGAAAAPMPPQQTEIWQDNRVVRGKTQALENTPRELYFPDMPQAEEAAQAAAVNADQMFLAGIVASHRDYPEEGLLNGQSVFAIFREADGACGTVAVTYPAFYQAEIWHACPNGEVSRVSGAEDLPGLPEDEQFQAQRQFTIHSAYLQARAEAQIGDYLLIGRALGVAGPDGCTAIESDVLWRGAVLDVARQAVCSQGE